MWLCPQVGSLFEIGRRSTLCWIGTLPKRQGCCRTSGVSASALSDYARRPTITSVAARGRWQRQLPAGRPGLGQAGWIRTDIVIGNHPALGNGCRNRSGPLRLTSSAGAGRSAREAPASGCPRTATRCCRAASSPLRSSRCAFGSGRTPRCRRERGSHARPPTD